MSTLLKKLRGQQIMITVYNAPGHTNEEWSIAYSTTDSFSYSPNVVDTSNKDDGQGASSEVVNFNWSLSASHIGTWEDATSTEGIKSIGFKTLQSWFETGQLLTIRWGVITDTTGGELSPTNTWKIAKGKTGPVKITELTTNAPNGELFTYDITFSAQGMFSDYTASPSLSEKPEVRTEQKTAGK